MNILYLALGQNINNHIEAHFSIFSFLTQGKKINTINVVTDNPNFYRDLKNYINVITVDEKILNEWKGRNNFFWRIKIKAIEMLCNLYKNEPVLYLDADTFLYKNCELLKISVLQGTALMHRNEGKLSGLKGKTVRKMWSQVQSNTYGSVAILPSHPMWNAGVVATPNKKNNEECLLALAICDEMCEQKVTPRLIEQFSLSVALDKMYGLQAANDSIAHYWSNKDEWNKVIENFFISAHFNSLTVDQITDALKSFDFSKVAVDLKMRNTNRRLISLIKKIYPAKNITFVSNHLQ